MVSNLVLATAAAEWREFIAVFLVSGSHGLWTVDPKDAKSIRYYANGVVTVERHNGGVVMLPAEHCGFEFGPPSGVA